jgi:hypothetical protein
MCLQNTTQYYKTYKEHLRFLRYKVCKNSKCLDSFWIWQSLSNSATFSLYPFCKSNLLEHSSLLKVWTAKVWPFPKFEKSPSLKLPRLWSFRLWWKQRLKLLESDLPNFWYNLESLILSSPFLLDGEFSLLYVQCTLELILAYSIELLILCYHQNF